VHGSNSRGRSPRRGEPAFEDAFEPARSEMFLDIKQQGVSHSDPTQGRAQCGRTVVCDEAAADLNVEPLAIVAKVPWNWLSSCDGLDPNAVMGGQVARMGWSLMSIKIARRGDDDGANRARERDTDHVAVELFA